MQGPLHARLQPVRRRQQWLLAVRTAVTGLLLASAVTVLLGLGKGLLGWPVPLWVPPALLTGGVVAGAALALLRRSSWHAAALAVDNHYQLKDCTVTALAFLSHPPVTVFQEVVIADAIRRLGRIDPAEVVPLRLPRSVPAALGTVAVTLALLFWPGGTPEASAGPGEAVPGIVAEAENIEEDLKDIEQVARQEGDEKLLQLVQELRKKAEAMKQPGATLQEALAKISEIQSAIAGHAAELNTQLVDDKLKTLGEAMDPAASLEQAAQALQEGNYEKAARALENSGEPRFDEREAKAVEERMNRAAQEMRAAGLRRLSATTERMSAGIRGEKKEFRQGARELAKEVRQQERRKRINQLLAREQSRLGECKNRSQQAWQSWLDQQRNQANKQNQSQNQNKSGSENRTAGQGGTLAGNTVGKRTRLTPQSPEDKLPSQPGAGEAGDKERVGASPQGTGKARTAYREQYQKYRREVEAALESESIPLGQRQTIRRYFDLIHPSTMTEDRGGPRKE